MELSWILRRDHLLLQVSKPTLLDVRNLEMWIVATVTESWIQPYSTTFSAGAVVDTWWIHRSAILPVPGFVFGFPGLRQPL